MPAAPKRFDVERIQTGVRLERRVLKVLKALAESLVQIRRTIRNYAGHLGQPDRYHETITVAYLALIQQHICERGNGGEWPVFARDNPELFRPGLLREFYPQAQLESEMARSVFLLPRSPALSSRDCWFGE